HVVARAADRDDEDCKRRQIAHGDAVAQREVLRIDDRGPTSRGPFVAASHHALAVLLEKRLVRGVPIGTLPSGGFEEDRAERLLALIERAEADPSVGLPLLARVDDAIGLVEPLRGAPSNMCAGFLVVVEAG